MLSCFTDKKMQQSEVLPKYLLLRDLWGRLDLALLRIEGFQFLVFSLSSVFFTNTVTNPDSDEMGEHHY